GERERRRGLIAHDRVPDVQLIVDPGARDPDLATGDHQAIAKRIRVPIVAGGVMDVEPDAVLPDDLHLVQEAVTAVYRDADQARRWRGLVVADHRVADEGERVK